MTIVQRIHLKTRFSKPFNMASKHQEQIAKIVANNVWEKLLELYPQYKFNNLKTLGKTSLEAGYCIDYLNRGGYEPQKLYHHLV